MDALPLVPAKFSPTDALLGEDGEVSEVTLGDVLTFSLEDVPNLYTLDRRTQVFRFHYTEGDVVTRLTARVSGQSAFTPRFVREASSEGGVNYIGRVEIHHANGEVCAIRMPGERSFDPAAADHRTFVNRPTFRLVACIAVAEIQALRYGAPRDFLDAIHAVLTGIIDLYYGKFMLQDWMKHQVSEACCERKTPLLYPQFIQSVLLRDAVKVVHRDRVESNLQELRTAGGSPPALLRVHFMQALMAERTYRKELKQELGGQYARLKAILKETGLAQAIGKKILQLPEPLVENPESTLPRLRERATALESLYIKRICQLLSLDSFDIEKPLSGQCVLF